MSPLFRRFLAKVSHIERPHERCEAGECVTYPHFRGRVPHALRLEYALRRVVVGHFGGVLHYICGIMCN